MPTLPDFSLVMGSIWLDGDSFHALPQNGNDAASMLQKRGQMTRAKAEAMAIENIRKVA